MCITNEYTIFMLMYFWGINILFSQIHSRQLYFELCGCDLFYRFEVEDWSREKKTIVIFFWNEGS